MSINSLCSCSFATDIYSENYENKYTKELSNIKTKEDLEKSSQKAVKSGDIDTWITGLSSMPTSRQAIRCEIVDGKIYSIGGLKNSLRKLT